MGEAEGHELGDLGLGDFADGGFVGEFGGGVVGGDIGDGFDAGLVHNDGVAFGMSGADIVAVDNGMKFLVGVSFGN